MRILVLSGFLLLFNLVFCQSNAKKYINSLEELNRLSTHVTLCSGTRYVKLAQEFIEKDYNNDLLSLIVSTYFKFSYHVEKIEIQYIDPLAIDEIKKSYAQSWIYVHTGNMLKFRNSEFIEDLIELFSLKSDHEMIGAYNQIEDYFFWMNHSELRLISNNERKKI